MAGWQTHGSRTVFENPWLRLRADEVTRPEHLTAVWAAFGVDADVAALDATVPASTPATAVAIQILFMFASLREGR
jgi:hypothetical protein